jgi:arylsulfatase A-like enzyme
MGGTGGRWCGRGGAWRDDLMCETHGHHQDHVGRVVLTDRFKYVANRGDMDELYDLTEDPFEMTNVIDDAACEPVLADMKRRLAAWQRTRGDRQAGDTL